MSTIYRICRSIYHLVPAPVRSANWLQRVSQTFGRRFGGHDAVYTDYYYRNIVDPGAQQIAGPIADLLAEIPSPRTVIDIGCESGAVLSELVRRGWQGVGLEYSEAGLAICRERGLIVHKFDISAPNSTEMAKGYQVAVSMEVAEHLQEVFADRYIDLLVASAQLIVFTAAPPGQTGTDHVNEQPPEYWIEKFASRGFSLLPHQTGKWKTAILNTGVTGHYQKNLMLFRNSGSNLLEAGT